MALSRSSTVEYDPTGGGGQTEELPSNLSVKLTCGVLMLGSGLMCTQGRGLLNILQGVGGVMFAVEGYWGAANYQPRTIRRLLKILVVYIAMCVVLGVVHLQFIDEYCSPAVSSDEKSRCEGEAYVYAYSLIFAGGVVILPSVFAVTYVFYRKLNRVLEYRLAVQRQSKAAAEAAAALETSYAPY